MRLKKTSIIKRLAQQRYPTASSTAGTTSDGGNLHHNVMFSQNTRDIKVKTEVFKPL